MNLVQIFERVLRREHACTCTPDYTGRNLVDPDCVWHEIDGDAELLVEELKKLDPLEMLRWYRGIEVEPGTDTNAPSHFMDDRHALYCGWVLGKLMSHSIITMPVIIDGNYTDAVTLIFDDESLEMVIGYPPAEWTPTD